MWWLVVEAGNKYGEKQTKLSQFQQMCSPRFEGGNRPTMEGRETCHVTTRPCASLLFPCVLRCVIFRCRMARLGCIVVTAKEHSRRPAAEMKTKRSMETRLAMARFEKWQSNHGLVHLAGWPHNIWKLAFEICKGAAQAENKRRSLARPR